MEITESDFQQWWSMPIGIEVKKMLRERMVNITEIGFSESVLRDQIKAGIFLGRKQEIKDLLEMNFNELMGYADESNRNKAG